jgi:hypothetical protein
MTDPQPTDKPAMRSAEPWDEGDKVTILEWWERWKAQDKKPESVNLTATHFERLLEGAVAVIASQRAELETILDAQRLIYQMITEKPQVIWPHASPSSKAWSINEQLCRLLNGENNGR